MSTNDPRALGAEGFDHLVYVRLFEGCNLACQHCFIPANPKKMTEEQLKKLPSDFSKFAQPGQTILVQWHGGEPTMLGHDVIEKAIEHWKSEYTDYKFKFGIQTNLLTYNSEWERVYKEHFDGQVGISWDPEIRLTRKGRPETNADFENQFWAKVEQLVSDGIEPYLVVTGTRKFFEKFQNPHDFFEMMESRGIPNGHIERLTKTGVARQYWDEIGLSNKEHSRYMLRFARSYIDYLSKPRMSDSKPIHLSPFDGLVSSIERMRLGGSGGSGCLSGVCDTRFHTFDASGYKKGCTALTSEVDNKNAGEQVIQIADLRFARKLRQHTCVGCPYLSICSSGCMATDKWDESGECSGGSILFKGIEELV